MSRPRVLVVGHRRELDSALGRHRACVVSDGYLEHLHAAGAAPLIAWPGTSEPESLLEAVEAVLLIGGGDVDPRRFGSHATGDAIDPSRDDFEIAIVDGCRTNNLPLLGMCRGAQVLNVALGGTLKEVRGHRQEGDLMRPSHSVHIDADSALAGFFGATETKVNSFHRWAADGIPSDMRVVARSPDGTVEGTESTSEWWAMGIQWHAELLDDPYSHALFAGFVSTLERQVSR